MNETLPSGNLSTDRSSDPTWNEFWFSQVHTSGQLRIIRAGFALLAIWYFISHLADAGQWFSASGILATERLGRFLQSADLLSETQWRLSPLYWIQSTALLRGFLIIGVALALATFATRVGRFASIGLWLCCVWLANRSLLIDGPEELVLCFGLMYLAIATRCHESHWTQSFALRLIQVHTTLLLAITGMTMLSSEIWWDGTGSISLAAPGQRRLFDLSELLSGPGLHEPLTHAVVFTSLVAPIALWIRRTCLLAYVSLLIWCLVLALLSSQWMYFMAIVLLLQSFAPQSWFLPHEQKTIA
jgi:hypothetical protein